MVHVQSIDERIQDVVGEAVAGTGHADADTDNGLRMSEDLRREFPHATIMTLNLAELIAAVQGAVENPEA
jgi:hypothetical protein